MLEVFAGVEGILTALSLFGLMLWLHRMARPIAKALELAAKRRDAKPKKVAAIVKRILERGGG